MQPAQKHNLKITNYTVWPDYIAISINDGTSKYDYDGFGKDDKSAMEMALYKAGKIITPELVEEVLATYTVTKKDKMGPRWDSWAYDDEGNDVFGKHMTTIFSNLKPTA